MGTQSILLICGFRFINCAKIPDIFHWMLLKLHGEDDLQVLSLIDLYRILRQQITICDLFLGFIALTSYHKTYPMVEFNFIMILCFMFHNVFIWLLVGQTIAAMYDLCLLSWFMFSDQISSFQIWHDHLSQLDPTQQNMSTKNWC